MGLWERIRAAVTRREPTAKPAELVAAGSSLGALPIYDQFSRIGGSVTPEQVSAIYRQADNGYTYQLVDLGNECRQKDGHLQGILKQREQALGPLQLEVQPYIEPGETKPTDLDSEIAVALRRALDDCDGMPSDADVPCVGQQELREHLQGANFWGYAMAETVWQKNRQGLLVPAGFYCHSPRRFGFRLSDGALVQWDQTGSQNSDTTYQVQRKAPGRWIQHQPRITGDVPAREGLCRVLIWCAIFRNWTISDVLKLAEMTWKPYRIGRYKKGASSVDVAHLVATLQGLTSNGIATLREDVEYELKWPEKGQSGATNHLQLAEFLGKEMSKAVLHGTLMTDAGDRGARSLGEVHERGFDSAVQHDARRIATTLKRDIATPFVRMNYGERPGIPNIVIGTKDEVDMGDFADAIDTLSNKCGLRVSTRYVYDRTGISQPEEGDEILGEDVDLSDLDGAEPEPAAEQNEEAAGEEAPDQADTEEDQEPEAEPAE